MRLDTEDRLHLLFLLGQEMSDPDVETAIACPTFAGIVITVAAAMYHNDGWTEAGE